MRYLLTTLFIFLIQSIIAQSYAGKDSEWIYDYYGTWAKGVTKINYEKDTLIDSRLVYKFLKTAYWRSSGQSKVDTFALKPIYFYTKAGITEFSLDAVHFDTLYNFNAGIGDSWKIFYGYEYDFPPDSIKITVIDTFRTTIAGTSLFTQAIELDYHFSSGRVGVDTIYEDIGYKLGYVLPWDQLLVSLDGGEGGLLNWRD